MTDEFEKKQFILRKNDQGLEDVLSAMLCFVMAWKGKIDIEVIIRIYKKDRTLLQNDYFHGWILRENVMKQLNEAGYVIIMQDGTEALWDVDKLKEYCKQPEIIDQVHKRKFFFVDGVEHAEEIHPSKWKKDKFSKYCQAVCDHFALVYDIYVPEPQSGYWLSIYNELNRGR